LLPLSISLTPINPNTVRVGIFRTSLKERNMKYAKIDLGYEIRFLAYREPEHEVATGIQVTKLGDVYGINIVNAIVSNEHEIGKDEFKKAYKDAIEFFNLSLKASKKNKKWESRFSEIVFLKQQGKGATSIAKTLGVSRDYVYKIIRKERTSTLKNACPCPKPTPNSSEKS